MLYGPTAMERAMRIQEVILRAVSGQVTWIQAADILGMDPRSLRRWRARYEREGYSGLLDRRTGRPSPRRVPLGEVERVLRLYRERYPTFNVRHFVEFARRDHDVKLSYTFIQRALQGAGLVRKRKARGRHRRRREPKPCFGQMLHLDGSRHPWLALCPDQRQTLIAVVDDATSRLLYAELGTGETTEAVLKALRTVFECHGLPMSLYTDRAGWARPSARRASPREPEVLTQVGRALHRLGVDHILAHSPQARGRGERVNRTLQDRLVNELRLADIRTLEEANAYLRDRFIAAHNANFAREPADPHSAFVGLGGVPLEQVLCREAERVVAPDNTVAVEKLRLQIAKQPGLPTCVGSRVWVRQHSDHTWTVWKGPRLLGTFDPWGKPIPFQPPPRAKVPA